jgi:hypothetical protein
VKFVYKINSSFDGFTPSALPERMDGGVLHLGWTRYLEAVSRGDEVWIYFKGPHRFEPGVYARGRVRIIDEEAAAVLVSIFEHRVDAPIVVGDLARQIDAVIAVRYLQVFPVPEALPFATDCSISTTAQSCRERRCEDCSIWPTLAQISETDLLAPSRSPTGLFAFAPAFWVVAPRSVAYGRERPSVSQTSALFYRFKTGQGNLAFPLALAMSACIRRRQVPEIDALVPIPLSPDKARRGELHRTLALAQELSLLTGIEVKELLTLSGPISKTALKLSAGEFEERYQALLEVHPDVARVRSVLLVDDVSTHGSTAYCAYGALTASNRDLAIGLTTAGQMTVKSAVGRVGAVAIK